PGAEVFGGERLRRDFLDVAIDVARVDALRLSGLIEVLEELLTGQLAALLDDACEPAIVDADRMPNTALAAKLEPQRGATHLHVAVAACRQPERSILSSVLLVADTNEALLEQLHDGREHLAPRQPRLCEVDARPASNQRQRAGELLHAIEL